ARVSNGKEAGSTRQTAVPRFCEEHQLVHALGAAGHGAGASHVGEPPGSPGGVPLAHPDSTPLEESTIEQAAARSAGVRLTLLALLVLAAGLRLWRLDQHGGGTR